VTILDLHIGQYNYAVETTKSKKTNKKNKKIPSIFCQHTVTILDLNIGQYNYTVKTKNKNIKYLFRIISNYLIKF